MSYCIASPYFFFSPVSSLGCHSDCAERPWVPKPCSQNHSSSPAQDYPLVSSTLRSCGCPQCGESLEHLSAYGKGALGTAASRCLCHSAGRCVDNPTLCSTCSLDQLLDSGLYTGEMTELMGAPGSGKTQVSGTEEGRGRMG